MADEIAARFILGIDVRAICETWGVAEFEVRERAMAHAREVNPMVFTDSGETRRLPAEVYQSWEGYYIQGEAARWIIPAKCASTTLTQYLDGLRAVTREEFAASDLPITMSVYHPWRRLRAALLGPGIFQTIGDKSGLEQRVFKHILLEIEHFGAVRPMAAYADGFKVDRFIRVEDLAQHFPDIPRQNAGEWTDDPPDFAEMGLSGMYAEDFELWEDAELVKIRTKRGPEAKVSAKKAPKPRKKRASKKKVAAVADGQRTEP